MLSRKMVSVPHDGDILCTLQYEAGQSSLGPGTPLEIATYNITGIEGVGGGKLDHLGKPKVQVSFLLDSNGMYQVIKAEAVFEELTEMSDSESNSTAINDDADSAPTDDAVTEPEKAGMKRMKKKLHRFPLKFARSDIGIELKPMSDRQKKQELKLLATMKKVDEERKAKEAAKNKLESSIYSLRESVFGEDVEDTLKKIATPTEIEDLKNQMDDNEEWLYGDGVHAPLSEYQARDQSQRKLADAILLRISEYPLREKFAAKLRSIMKESREMVDEWAKTKPWITGSS